MLIKQGKIAITLVCIVLGIMLAVQFRFTQDNRGTLRYQRLEDLSQQLNQTEKERDALLNEVRQLRQSAGSGAASQEMDLIKAKAGLVAFAGPGVVITMDDTTLASVPGKSSDIFIIRDEDILKIMNELKAAGAEAISINGHRLVATSEVRTAGNGLSVNNTRIAAPFEIKAIGDPATLDTSLRMRGGVIEALQVWGIRISVKKEDRIQVPAYKGLFRFELAQPIQEDKQ